MQLLPDMKKVTFPIAVGNVEMVGRVVDPALLEMGADANVGIAAAWTVLASGEVKVSLRSDGEKPNVEKIVQYLKKEHNIQKGGGHDSASVWVLPSVPRFWKIFNPQNNRQVIESLWGLNP